MELLPAELDSWPVHAAGPELLADLELLLAGARLDLGGDLRPRGGGRVALRRLPDVAEQVAGTGRVVLADPEGTPLAVVAVDGEDGQGVGRPADAAAAPGVRAVPGAAARPGRRTGGAAARAGARRRLRPPAAGGRSGPDRGGPDRRGPADRPDGGPPGRRSPARGLVRAVLAAGRALGTPTVVAAPLRRLAGQTEPRPPRPSSAACTAVTDVLARRRRPLGDVLARLDRRGSAAGRSSPRRRSGPSCAAGARRSPAAAWSSSSPACPARASRPSRGRSSTRCSRTAGAA